MGRLMRLCHDPSIEAVWYTHDSLADYRDLTPTTVDEVLEIARYYMTH